MTVIEFGRKDVRVNVLSIALGVLVVASVGFGIMSYNRVSSLRHDITSLEDHIKQEQVRNAESKNALYARIDSVSPETFLTERGYVLEQNPAYEQGSILSSR